MKIGVEWHNRGTQNTPNNILLRNVKLEMYVVIQESKNFKNKTNKNSKKHIFYLKMLITNDLKLFKRNSYFLK